MMTRSFTTRARPAARTWLRAGAIAIWLTLAAAGAWAERLPLTQLTRAEGLVDDVVTALVEDPRGFLWVGTVNGVSRFDGSLFRTYQVRDGSLVHSINAVIHASDGDVWFATNGGGVARLDRTARRGVSSEPSLTRYRLGEARRPNRVNTLVEDDDGALWAATDGGLFRLEAQRDAFERVPLNVPGVDDEALYVPAAALDADGRLWLGTERGLMLLSPEGTTTLIAPDAAANESVLRVAVDDRGRVWAGTYSDVRVLRLPSLASRTDGAGRPGHEPGLAISARACAVARDGTVTLPALAGESCAITGAHGLPEGLVQGLSVTADGRVLMGTASGGVFEIADGRMRLVVRPHNRHSVTSVLEDRHGNLWIGTDAGLLRLARDGLVTFDSADGLRGVVRRIFASRRGSVYAVTDDESIYELDGRTLRGARPRYPAGAGKPTWGSWHLPDPDRGWWVPTNAGLCRYDADEAVDALGRATAARCYTIADGLPSNDIAHVFRSSRGALWVGTRATSGPVLARWDAATRRFTVLEVDGLAPVSTPVDIVEDPDGALWIGFRDGGVARCLTAVSAERVEATAPREGASSNAIRCAVVLSTSSVSRLLVDGSGRVWITTTTGLLRVDHRAGDPVRVSRHYTSGDGLSSDSVFALIDDRLGRIYVGTRSGVDRLDPATGIVRYFSEADGLAAGGVLAACRDAQDRLWFGTRHGVSLFVPADEAELPPVSPRVAFIKTGDREWPIAEFGAARVDGVELPSPNSRLEIGFFAADPGRSLRLQYRLRGVDEWSDARPASLAVYPRLAPGRYDFEVRSLNETGLESAENASIQFRVPPPFWLRWPFLTLAILIGATLAFVAHRVRVSRLLALERVRTHIATDLHDDIGSTLTRIALLAERTRRRARGDETVGASLGAIASASRDLVETMSDIVWAVNPRHDSVSDLTHRMRRFAGEVLGDAEIALSFSAPPDGIDAALGPDLRRAIYLVLKECVTNIVKHAGARGVEIELRVDGHELRLTVADNGRGFDPQAPTDGTGLASLRRRAARINGRMTIDSAAGRGARVTLAVDLKRPPAVSLGPAGPA